MYNITDLDLLLVSELREIAEKLAIKNAKKLLKVRDPEMTGNHNPSTTVHLLVEELNKYIP